MTSTPGSTSRDSGDDADVVMVGGGPAGAAAASLLAAWGRSVVVLAKPPSTRMDLAESLPPSAVRLLDRLGMHRRVAAAGFVASRGNSVWWGAGGPRIEPFADGLVGYQVLRRRLDAVLLAGAEAAGAVVRRDTTVRAVDCVPGRVPVVHVEHPGGRRTIGARWVLDCSGRAGVLARSHRDPGSGARTLALAAVWRRTGGWSVPDDSHTLIESYADGWAWSIPVDADHRYVTVMVDPQRTNLADSQETGVMYHGELAKLSAFPPLMVDASMTDGPAAFDASSYTSRVSHGDRYLLVGDAASFIDPLSSYGVKKALASGWFAAVTVNTCLGGGPLATAALDLYDDLERRMSASARRGAGPYFQAGTGPDAHPFWLDRAEVSPEGAGGPGSEADVDSLRTDPDVLGAFAAIRRAERLALAPSDRLDRVSKPVMGERLVEWADHLTHPALPGDVRYVRGVVLPDLVTIATEWEHVPEMFDAYNRTHPPAILPDFLGALAVLVGKGLVVDRAVFDSRARAC